VAFFAYGRAQVAHPLDASGCIVPRREGLAITAATFVSSKYPGRAPAGAVLLRAFLGGARSPECMDRPDDELLELAEGELRGLLGVRGAATLSRLYRYQRANPQPLLGHAARLRRLKARLAALPGIFAAGGGYEGVGIPDCIKQGEALAAAALADRPASLRAVL
jgi:oxygen-dependent protoporphyrinogen oxidase